MSNIREVAAKIRKLENERQDLLREIEEVKKLADSKASALESEVSMLREELKALRLILSPSQLQEETDLKKQPRHSLFR